MVEILEKEDIYLIMLDKEHTNVNKLNNIKKYLSVVLNDIDFVDEEEQLELEKILDSLNEYDREVLEVKEYSI